MGHESSGLGSRACVSQAHARCVCVPGCACVGACVAGGLFEMASTRAHFTDQQSRLPAIGLVSVHGALMHHTPQDSHADARAGGHRPVVTLPNSRRACGRQQMPARPRRGGGGGAAQAEHGAGCVTRAPARIGQRRVLRRLQRTSNSRPLPLHDRSKPIACFPIQSPQHHARASSDQLVVPLPPPLLIWRCQTAGSIFSIPSRPSGRATGVHRGCSDGLPRYARGPRSAPRTVSLRQAAWNSVRRGGGGRQSLPGEPRFALGP